jgi:hypothetical protein
MRSNRYCGPAAPRIPPGPEDKTISRSRSRRLALLTLVTGLALPALLHAGVWSGYIQSEVRMFQHEPADPRQRGDNLSLATEPEYYTEWDNRRQSLTFEGFLRWDQHDDERSHADIRELVWQKAGDTWELRAGISKVFWGVAESQHLVDIINQTDLVENIDQEDKLGQPMVNLALIRNWGTLDLFVLPGFRERTFPGIKGRLRSLPQVDTDHPRYASGAEDRHVDFAIRWSHYLGDWDFGLAHFYGTARNPRLLPGLSDSGEAVLIPLYETIDQTSLDLQATKGDWLWKLEWLTSSGQGERYSALVGGFEYTIVGIFDSAADLGFIGEYHFDDRDENAPTPFEDDIMVGLRLALNDVQSTEVLFGVIADRKDSARTYNLEASRRLGENWILEVEARLFSNASQNGPLFSFRDDDHVQFTLARHF